MAIVKEYTNGSSKVYIHDDYIRDDPKEIQAIVDRVSILVRTALRDKTA